MHRAPVFRRSRTSIRASRRDLGPTRGARRQRGKADRKRQCNGARIEGAEPAHHRPSALSVALGVALNFTGIDPIKALYWSAVINGVLAAPIMVIMMLLVRRKSVMGNLIVTGPVYCLGWIATAAMGFCIVGMAVSIWT